MATPAQRFESWVDGFSGRIKDRLRGWMASFIFGGITDAFEDINPAQKSSVDAILQDLIDNPDTPEHIREFLRHATERGNPLVIAAAVLLVPLMMIPLVTGALQPLGNLWNYTTEKVFHSGRLDIPTITSLWNRDRELNEQFWQDARDLGMSEERIAALKKLASIIPPLADMVRFADFGSFDPEIIAKWREFYDAPGWMAEPMALLGVKGDWANKYWFSHWRQPGRYELGELHRRGLIDDEIVKMAYLTQGFSSFWQDKLLALVKEPWTRVDTRRMWDMRTINDEQLRKAYQAVGYYDEQLEGMVLWTKVYVAFPDLIARFKNGWITEDDVRNELLKLGMPYERVNELIETKVKGEEPARVEADRDLTKTDIYKGVKQDRITRDEAIELLMDLNFDRDEADYLLAINIPSDETDTQVEYRKLSKSEIRTALASELITEVDARTRLTELRYSPIDVELIITIFNATIKPPTDPKLREASKADIVLGVKKGIISPEEAYLMLQDIGFTPEASEFILLVKAESSPFSPVNFAEFKDLTTKYRIATGREVKPMSEEIKKAADEVVKLTAEVEALDKSIKEEKGKLIEGEELPPETTARLEELQVDRNRAISALELAKSDYNSKVAEWKHSG